MTQNAIGVRQPDVQRKLAEAEATRAAARDKMFRARPAGPQIKSTPVPQPPTQGVKIEEVL